MSLLNVLAIELQGEKRRDVALEWHSTLERRNLSGAHDVRLDLSWANALAAASCSPSAIVVAPLAGQSPGHRKRVTRTASLSADGSRTSKKTTIGGEILEILLEPWGSFFNPTPHRSPK